MPRLMIGACQALACTLYFLGDFETSATIRDAWCSDLALGRRTASGRRGSAPSVMCLCWEALSEWHLGEIASSRPTMAEAISLAKELNDMYGVSHGAKLCSDSRPHGA